MWLIEKSAGEAIHFVEVYVDGPIGHTNSEAGYWTRSITERMNSKGLNAYDLVNAIDDYIVSASDDGDGALQDAPEEVKAEHRKRLEDLYKAREILLPYAMDTAETLGLRKDIL